MLSNHLKPTSIAPIPFDMNTRLSMNPKLREDPLS